jgi:hypothetical protein
MIRAVLNNNGTRMVYLSGVGLSRRAPWHLPASKVLTRRRGVFLRQAPGTTNSKEWEVSDV